MLCPKHTSSSSPSLPPLALPSPVIGHSSKLATPGCPSLPPSTLMQVSRCQVCHAGQHVWMLPFRCSSPSHTPSALLPPAIDIDSTSLRGYMLFSVSVCSSPSTLLLLVVVVVVVVVVRTGGFRRVRGKRRILAKANAFMKHGSSKTREMHFLFIPGASDKHSLHLS
jgi:hypothetical protein